MTTATTETTSSYITCDGSPRYKPLLDRLERAKNAGAIEAGTMPADAISRLKHGQMTNHQASALLSALNQKGY
jgi:hypothetical protein